MIKSVLRFVMGAFKTIVIAASPFTPAGAMGGGAGGGTGSGTYPSSLMRLNPADQPSAIQAGAHRVHTQDQEDHKAFQHSTTRQLLTSIAAPTAS